VKLFVAGATGAIGRRLLPLLLAEGHEVTGMTRSPQRAQELEALGARGVVADALDAGAVREAIGVAQPEVVIHQLTALPQRIDPRRIERDFELNDRLRSEGSAILAAAARDAGVARLVAQSIAFSYEPGPPGTVHVEEDPLVRRPAPSFARTADAIERLERTTHDHGYFYGPGSAIAPDGSIVQDLRRRRMPLVGSGAGVWSFIHVDDAADATVAALSAPPGVYNVVDDEPAPVGEWLPALARAAGAPRPLRVPAFIARLAAGDYGVQVMTAAQGASNALAKRELSWRPAHASWREGFSTALG